MRVAIQATLFFLHVLLAALNTKATAIMHPFMMTMCTTVQRSRRLFSVRANKRGRSARHGGRQRKRGCKAFDKINSYGRVKGEEVKMMSSVHNVLYAPEALTKRYRRRLIHSYARNWSRFFRAVLPPRRRPLWFRKLVVFFYFYEKESLLYQREATEPHKTTSAWVNF